MRQSATGTTRQVVTSLTAKATGYDCVGVLPIDAVDVIADVIAMCRCMQACSLAQGWEEGVEVCIRASDAGHFPDASTG